MTDWKLLREHLAAYVEQLALGVVDTSRAEDRPTYAAHLAAAAIMLANAVRERSITELKLSVADERRSFGYGFLSGECGARAEAAFANFADFVEKL